MPAITLTYFSEEIHGVKFGSGPRLLVALPGYNDRTANLEILEQVLGERFTVYAIDLPKHGNTHWNRESFSPADLNALVLSIMQLEQKQELSLLGHSLGARLLLSTMVQENLPVEEVILLAPDGLDTKGLQFVQLFPSWLRHLMCKLLANPDWLLTLARFARRLKLLPASISHFILVHLANRVRRERMCWYWDVLPNFPVSMKSLSAFLKSSDTAITIYLGERDKTVRTKSIQNLAAGLPRTRLYMIDQDHQMVNAKLNEQLH
ncbi:MAG: alpha/beta fold hydrolase [Saprospiraceae bacterium]